MREREKERERERQSEKDGEKERELKIKFYKTVGGTMQGMGSPTSIKIKIKNCDVNCF